MLLFTGTQVSAHAAIAQLDRVTDYESVGRGFESLSPYQKADTHSGICFLFYVRMGLEQSNATGCNEFLLPNHRTYGFVQRFCFYRIAILICV